jgi:hypothetical protein
MSPKWIPHQLKICTLSDYLYFFVHLFFHQAVYGRPNTKTLILCVLSFTPMYKAIRTPPEKGDEIREKAVAGKFLDIKRAYPKTSCNLIIAAAITTPSIAIPKYIHKN